MKHNPGRKLRRNKYFAQKRALSKVKQIRNEIKLKKAA